MNSFLTEPKPATSPKAIPTHRSITAEPRARILYVDDEPQLRRIGELVLAQSGYDVDTAADGVEGWDALQHAHYNLLITDNNMPRLTGLELATNARLAGMRLPILITSGSLSLLHDSTCAWLGFAAFLSKPFSSGALVDAVEQVLLARNNPPRRGGTVFSGFTHLAQSIQPFPHGGINE